MKLECDFSLTRGETNKKVILSNNHTVRTASNSMADPFHFYVTTAIHIQEVCYSIELINAC